MNRFLTFVRIVAGGLLLFAAGMKLLELFETGITTSSEVFAGSIGLIFLESILAVVCFTYCTDEGSFPLILVAALFFLFGVYQTSLYLGGAETCGCFGKFSLPPHIMAAIDFITSSMLISLLPNIKHNSTVRSGKLRSRFRFGFATTVFFAILGSISLIRAPMPAVATDRIPEQRLPFLRPTVRFDEGTVGQEFQFEKWMKSPTHDYQHGRWILIFVRDTCAACEEAKSRILEFTRSEVYQDHYAGLIFLGIDSNNDAGQFNLPIDGMFFEQANDRYGWVVPTPFFVELREGVVTKANSVPFF